MFGNASCHLVESYGNVWPHSHALIQQGNAVFWELTTQKRLIYL